MNIRKVTENDCEDLWNIFKEVVDEGNAFTSDSSVTLDKFKNMWVNENTNIAEIDDKIIGGYNIFSFNSGRGSHICCGAYMIKKDYRGKGAGYLLGKHSLQFAKGIGFKAIQFNCIVSTNKVAIRLWKKLGFKIKGKIPKAFNHKDLGYVDTYIMHRFL